MNTEENTAWIRTPGARYVMVAVALLVVLVALGMMPKPVAQDFTLPVIDRVTGRPTGEQVSLADLRGKVVVLDFFATWCGPCGAAAPGLSRLAHRYANRGVVLLGVNVDESGPALVPIFARRFGVDYRIVYDSGSASQKYGVQVLPTLTIIDRTGRIRHVARGAEPEASLASEIEAAL